MPMCFIRTWRLAYLAAGQPEVARDGVLVLHPRQLRVPARDSKEQDIDWYACIGWDGGSRHGDNIQWESAWLRPKRRT
jgi:hypothetical protein